MSIIYSYPTSQPTVDDLVIGTSVGDDNATKSFVLGDIVTLINAESGSGTLTGVTISTDAFLTAIGNPTGPVVAYTIGLAATGTPSATTFLRGDNQWVIPTVSAGIGVSSQNVTVTDDVSSFNFLGAGVSTSSDPNGNVQVTIAGAVNAVESVTAGAGIAIPSTTGNIIVSNTGVRQIIAGTGIAIDQPTGTGNVTMSVVNQTSGTVTSVTPGPGLVLTSGSTILNPSISVNYVGTQNYILETPSVAVALPDDQISFNQASSNDVKTSTLATVPMTTLPLVKTYIDAADASTVKNNTDTYTSLASVDKVITLTDAEYVAIATKDGNTLYLTTSTAATQFTKTLAITNNVSGFANGSLTGSQIGATLTGAENSSWSFTTGVSTTSGYSYTGNAPVTISGIFDSTSTVTSTITGSITQDSAPTCTSYLTTASGVTPALQASYFTLTPDSSSAAACTSSLNASSVFPVTYALTSAGTAAGYSYASAATTYSGNNGTYGNSPSITGTAQGTVSLNNYTYTVIVNTSGVTVASGSSFNVATSGTVAGSGDGTYSLSLASGTAYANTTTISAGANSNISGVTPSTSQTVTSSAGGIQGNVSTTHTFEGDVTSNTGNASMTLANNGISGPANGYQVEYYADGVPYIIGSAKSGTVGSSIAFSTGFTLNSGYTLITALSAVYSNGSGAVTIPGSVTVTLSGEVMANRGQGVYNSTSEVSSNEACQLGNPTETVFLSVGGSNIYAGITCYTSATGSGTVSDGYYKANNNNSWMRITGGNGYVQSTGSC
tara:strand:+ start:25 stop:2361 length:2337 start_codon:yes stop_codon:yes gene_type:complete